MELNNLNGPQRGLVAEAILAAFNQDSLNRLLVHGLNKPLLPVLVDTGAFKDQVFHLVELANQEAWTEQLIAAAQQASQNAKICNLLTALQHSTTAFAETQQTVQTVLGGIKELGELADTPAVHALLSASRDHLEQLERDLDYLARYKALHDVLHQLQIRQLRIITESARSFVDDSIARDLLVELINQLIIQAEEADGQIGDMPEKAKPATWWIDELNAVISGMREALGGSDERKAKEAVVRLKRILGSAPFEINRLLVDTARRIPIDRLTETLHDVASALGTESSSAVRLNSAVDALRQLSLDLQDWIEQHDAWQLVERDLLRISQLLEKPDTDSLEEVELLWPSLRQNIEVRFADEPEAEWAVELYRLLIVFDQMAVKLSDRSSGDTHGAFDPLRDTARHRFYRVDTTLKRRCTEILKLGQPLNKLLNEIID